MTLHTRDLPSPNHDDRPADTPIDMLILHYTGMQTAQEAIDRLRDPVARVSSHYVVDEDGSVLRLVPEERRAWHAGVSYWRGHAELNGRSIGIEIVNPGPRMGLSRLPGAADGGGVRPLPGDPVAPPDPARATSSRTATSRRTARRIRARSSTGRAWRRTASACGRATLPDLGATGGLRDAATLRDVRAALADIGYRVAPEGALDPALATVLRAFQRHWRPEAITGQADAGTLGRLLGVRRLVVT